MDVLTIEDLRQHLAEHGWQRLDDELGLEFDPVDSPDHPARHSSPLIEKLLIAVLALTLALLLSIKLD
ncbi:MAG: hypothetical protein E6Q97_29140 [Desulfurellales bacterium]|nr:MAG: hypothetical protein E6Q97_29140 [Desulfurellales bacterium]